MAGAALTVEAILGGWAVLLALLLVALWLYGGRRRAIGDSFDAGTLPERRFTDRRRSDLGPPPGASERRSGVDRRRAMPAV